jgi:NAD(P)-dependent dehydrogenase (short-subunit alcohol dehydrogenase family)
MATIEGLLNGKSVIITGAGSGVGRAAAELFARHGARLICADIKEDWLEETVAMVHGAGGEAKAVRCDVSQKADLQAAVDAAVAAYGRLDVIYNNAGISSPPNAQGAPAKFPETTEAQFDRLMHVNVLGVMNGCQVAIEQFRAQGGGGVIVNTASVAGLIGWGGVLYASTKGAVVNLTRALAMEIAKDNIRINSICPGSMFTHFGIGANGPVPEAIIERAAKMQPLGRNIEPSECADGALFLACDLSKNITGVNLPIDGGLSAGR